MRCTCSSPAAPALVKAEAERVPAGFGACTASWEPEAACADVPEPETPPSALEAVPSARAAAVQPQPAEGHAGRRQLLGPRRRSLPRLPVVPEEELAELPRRRSTLAGTPTEMAALQAAPAIMHRRYTAVSVAAALQDTALVRYVPCPPFSSGSKSVDGATATPVADPKGGLPAGNGEAASRLRLKRPASSAPLPPGPSSGAAGGGADGTGKGSGRSVGRVCLPHDARLRCAFERTLLGSTDVTGLLARGDDNLDRAILSAHGAPSLAVWYLAQHHK